MEFTGEDDDNNADLPSFSALADRTVFWYRGAERLLRRELAVIMSKASPNSRIDPNSLGLESLELLQLCMDHQNTWQDMCLIEDLPVGDSDYQQTDGIQAFKLGRVVLLGPGEGRVGVRDTQNLVKFLSAFEEQCRIYLGGPDGMDSR
jgi:hypothetical protein